MLTTTKRNVVGGSRHFGSPLLLAAVLSAWACTGNVGIADKSLCEGANEHLSECGASQLARDCSQETPDNECAAACDLERSCAYFQGNSPQEGKAQSQCSSRCTCESAQRRAEECGLGLTFDCNEICNCMYNYDCDGVQAYGTCRDDCPPHP